MSEMRIQGFDPKSLQSMKPEPGGDGTRAAKSFGQTLWQAVEKVNHLQHQADQAIQDLAVGRRRTLHETMIEVERASIAFQFFLSVRNKAMTAYQEIMRMHF